MLTNHYVNKALRVNWIKSVVFYWYLCDILFLRSHEQIATTPIREEGEAKVHVLLKFDMMNQ